MSVSDTSEPSKTDWAKLNEMSDETIDLSESPELDDDFFERATLRLPQSVAVTVEVDPDTLAWFKAQENSSQLMNAALRIYAEAHQKTV